MAMLVRCDSCDKEIAFSERVQLIYPSGIDAGVSLEICLACAAGVLNDTKIKKAEEAHRKRMAAAAAAAALRDRPT